MIYEKNETVELCHEADESSPSPYPYPLFIWEVGLVIAGCLLVVIACDWIASVT